MQVYENFDQATIQCVSGHKMETFLKTNQLQG